MTSKNLSRKKVSESDPKMIPFCPSCGSVDVALDTMPALIAYREYYYKCKKCGFFSKVFPEATASDIEKFRDEKKPQSKRKVK